MDSHWAFLIREVAPGIPNVERFLAKHETGVDRYEKHTRGVWAVLSNGA